MSHIAIVGAGRVGLAAAKIILHLLDWRVSLLDTSMPALLEAATKLQDIGVEAAASTSTFYISGDSDIKDIILALKPDVVMCTTPFHINVQVAQAAHEAGCHYIDFTEDNGVTREIAALPITNSTFVPQTGLAPGLISYIGLELFGELAAPYSLDLRVGALPQVAFGPAHYAITWSLEGLINEYLKPTYRKVNGVVQQVEPLQDLESLLVNGVIYEGFTTAGGVGDLSAYDHIPNVEYKTLRHPGHLDFLNNAILTGDNFTLEKGVERARRAFKTTRRDVVALAAYAVDVNGRSATFGAHFMPDEKLGLTALELTTAGTGVAVAELLLRGHLKHGVLTPSDISMQLLRDCTSAMGLVLSKATR